MKVIVSACLAGDNCKYNGGNNLNQKMMDFLHSHEIIKVCPEVLGGLPTPRPSAEIVDSQVMNIEGKNITKEFTLGAQKAFEIVQTKNPDLIIFSIVKLFLLLPLYLLLSLFPNNNYFFHLL